MYRCECANYRCKKQVSRSTWYRHKISTILADQLGAQSVDISEPLPVENAPPAEADVQQEAADVQQEEDPAPVEVHIS